MELSTIVNTFAVNFLIGVGSLAILVLLLISVGFICDRVVADGSRTDSNNRKG